ncbi:hypothetical protein EV681_3734 [Advenella incenata]|jgi:hypothetical protein|uniref:Uncharacterized protein n=1 Tax=Advenella incenata TaxID=267800 RepID=A0A4Q7V8F0_9BURK|nr:hypothetical protein EV681_3734 [Advenella incenata]
MVKKPLLNRFHYEKNAMMRFICLYTTCGKRLVASRIFLWRQVPRITFYGKSPAKKLTGVVTHTLCPDYQATLKPAAAPIPPAESHEVFRRRLLFFPVLKVTPEASAT